MSIRDKNSRHNKKSRVRPPGNHVREVNRYRMLAASLKSEAKRNQFLTKKLEDANARIQEMAQAQLQEQELFYKSLLQSINEIVVVLDTSGKITAVFGPLVELTEYSTPEVFGQPECFLFDDGDGDEEEDDEVIVIGQTVTNISGKYYGRFQSLKTKAGTRVPVSLVRSTFRGTDGGSQGAILVARPMRETKKLLKMARIIEGIQSGHVDAIKGQDGIIQMMDAGVLAENKRLMEDLERTNQKLSVFTSTASHDLKGPLLTVTAFLEILQSDYGSGLDEEALRCICSALRSATRMRTLVEGLLNYTRTHREQMDFETTDLNLIAKEVVDDLAGPIQTAGAKVVINHLPSIEASGLHMRQVFQNLIGNAIKYRRDGVGVEVIVSSDIVVGAASGNGDQDHCQITIQDNGIGFDETRIDIIFKPFKRLPSQGKFEGTGLGLYTVKEIIDFHQGSITATSTVGEGSTFIMKLPIKQSPRVPYNSTPSPQTTPAAASSIADTRYK